MKLNIFKNLIPDNSKQQTIEIAKSWTVSWDGGLCHYGGGYNARIESIVLLSEEDVNKFKDELISAFKFTRCNILIDSINIRENK